MTWPAAAITLPFVLFLELETCENSIHSIFLVFLQVAKEPVHIERKSNRLLPQSQLWPNFTLPRTNMQHLNVTFFLSGFFLAEGFLHAHMPIFLFCPDFVLD